MEWFWRRFFFPLVLLVTLFSFTATASAKPPTVKLQPARNTEYIFDSVELLEYSDQSVRFKVKGHREAGDEPMLLSIRIDPQSKTYTVMKKKPLADEQQVKGNALPNQQSLLPEGTLKTYTAKVGVVTEDPLNIDCCKSWLQLNWTVDLNYNRVVGYSKNKGQWDGQPTLGLTYWYCDWHNYTSYCGYNNSSAWAQSQARHHNYDWGNNNIATYAEHSMILNGNVRGSWTYECEWFHWGEDAYLLHGSVYFP
jgi:hypothetical protein